MPKKETKSKNRNQHDKGLDLWYNESQYNPAMCKQLIEMFGKGKGRQTFCKEYGISEKTFSAWIRKHPLFEAAYDAALEVGKEYYLDICQEHLIETKDGPRVNVSLLNKILNLRYNVGEKRRLQVNGLRKAKSVEEKLNLVYDAISDGSLTGDEAVQLMKVIDTAISVKHHEELEERIRQVEEAHKVGLDEGEFSEDEEFRREMIKIFKNQKK